MMSAQACIIFSLLFIAESQAVLLVTAATLVGFNYGTNLALFPSFAKDYWGAKNYGMNYGILFSAWGVGAFVLVRVSEMLKVKTGSITASFAVACGLLLVGAMMSLSLRKKVSPVRVELREPVAELDEEDMVLQEAGNK